MSYMHIALIKRQVVMFTVLQYWQKLQDKYKSSLAVSVSLL
jgi:hypothetical protein